jgi:hypothetical protein
MLTWPPPPMLMPTLMLMLTVQPVPTLPRALLRVSCLCLHLWPRLRMAPPMTATTAKRPHPMPCAARLCTFECMDMFMRVWRAHLAQHKSRVLPVCMLRAPMHALACAMRVRRGPARNP